MEKQSDRLPEPRSGEAPDELVTVIIPTYNFSNALRCAIESVLMQTHQRFELLVVGDGCTDDSEEVVVSFGDSRFSWFNLPKNAGNQYAPINFALGHAKGVVIAYLGHDDIWAPTHLECGLRTLRSQNADFAGAVEILIGPPETRMMGAIGLFPDDVFTLRSHIPPPAMMHRRDLLKRVGLWRSPNEAEIGTDFDFLARCYRAGARIAPTRQPTVFKFTTTFRRDAYRRKDTTLQRQTLDGLRQDPDAFIRSSLVAVIQCALEDRFIRIEPPLKTSERAEISASFDFLRWMRFKGARSRRAETLADLTSGPHRFFVDEEFVGFEWHLPEESPVHGHYRWNGPSRISTIPLPVRLETPALLRMLVVHVIDPGVLSSLVLRFNDRPLAYAVKPAESGAVVLEADLSPRPEEDDQSITIEVERTIRPFDSQGTLDRRWLGVAIGWIELSAATSPARPERNAG